MNLNYKLAVLLICMTTKLFAAAHLSSDSIFIAKYKADKACAISYTFDDGLLEQFTLLYPKLEKLGMKATFFINGNTVNEGEKGPYNNQPRISWKDLKTMSNQGHEISNHGWSHKNLVKCTMDEVHIEIDRNDSIIEARIGTRPITYCYAGNSKNDEVVRLASIHRVGTRTEQFSVGSKSTKENLVERTKALISSGDWGVTMTHGIINGYDAFKSDTILWDYLEYVKSLEDKIWVGTFREVAAYTAGQKNIRLEKIQKGEKYMITPHSTLDKSLFNYPLTMVVQKSGIHKISVKQNGKQLAVKIFPTKVLFDFNPHGGNIIIQIK
jgi:peptidoglycan/xylan/chitin deacetylase (PgdA/CDA1 family)